MAFDPKLKELARAHDAVDRLREVQDRIAGDSARTQANRDVMIRAALVAVIVAIVAYAYVRL